MTASPHPESATQRRVIALFRDELSYRYLGNWTDRLGNSNVEEAILTARLAKYGYTAAQIAKALHGLRSAYNPNHKLYDNNKAIYGLLYYGVKVKTEAGHDTDTVHLINWAHPNDNDFAIARQQSVVSGYPQKRHAAGDAA